MVFVSIARGALALAVSWVALGCGARTGTSLRETVALDAHASIDAFVARDAGMDAPTIPDAFFSVDARHDAFVPDAGDPCAVGTEPLADPVCTRALHAEDAVLSCPGGFVDVVARGDGTLRWECEGRRAEAVFSDRIYRGTRTGDRFALCIQTEFDYLDGCHWESSQRIEGALGDGHLDLTYREQATRGTGCFPPCTADARLDLP